MATSTRRQAQMIQRNTRQLMRQRIPRNIERALTGVGIVVANKAQEYTPVEYGLLINSQYRRVDAYANRYTVSIGYTQDYAVYLHGTKTYSPLWKPREPGKKEGPAWNPDAKPRFLDRAGDETRTTQTRIMLGDLKL